MCITTNSKNDVNGAKERTAGTNKLSVLSNKFTLNCNAWFSLAIWLVCEDVCCY